MPYPDLLRLYFDRSDALQSYWTLYVVVIGGLLGFATLRRRPDPVKVALVSLLYAGFAYKNLAAIGDVTAERATLLQGLQDDRAGPFSDRMRATLHPTAYADARAFHVGCDVLTLAAVWAMEWRRRRDHGPNPSA